MKALRLFTLALMLALTPALVCSAYAQDDDSTEQTGSPTTKKKKKSKKKKSKKKKSKKKVGAFKMEKKGFKKVFDRAKEANVPVMVLFTNPPSCPYCVKLEQEVLTNAQWKKGVNGKILCVYIDFECKDPMAKELSASLPHQGIPTYFFVDPHTMKPLGPAGGYMTGRPIKTYIDGVDYACEAMRQAHPDDAEEAEEEEETEE